VNKKVKRPARNKVEPGEVVQLSSELTKLQSSQTNAQMSSKVLAPSGETRKANPRLSKILGGFWSGRPDSLAVALQAQA